MARVRREAELREDVDVVRRERDEPLRAGRAVRAQADDTEARDRVGGTRLRVALPAHLVAHRDEVDDRERRHARLVELQVRDLPRVGRPHERLSGAGGELLLVDPVEPPVEHRLRAGLRQLRLTPARDVHQPEVAPAHEGDLRPVRRGLGELLLFGRAHERARRPRADVDREDVAGGRHQQRLAVRQPLGARERQRPGLLPRLRRAGVRARGRGRSRARGRAGARRRSRRGRHQHLRAVQEDARLPGLHVESLERGRLASSAQVGESPAVRMPGEARRQGARERRLGVDALDRELGRRAGDGGGRRCEGQRQAGEVSQGAGRAPAGEERSHRGGLRRTGRAAPRPEAADG